MERKADVKSNPKEEPVEDNAKQVKKEYLSKLTFNLKKIEEIYGLNTVVGDKSSTISLLPINQFVENVMKILDSYDGKEKDIINMNRDCSQECAIINYISQRSYFFGVKLFEFKYYINLVMLVDVLKEFSAKANITAKSKRKLNAVFTILEDAEQRNPKLRWSLTFRYLRMFCVLVLFSNYIDASILATFLLRQLNLNIEGLDDNDTKSGCIK